MPHATKPGPCSARNGNGDGPAPAASISVVPYGERNERRGGDEQCDEGDPANHHNHGRLGQERKAWKRENVNSIPVEGKRGLPRVRALASAIVEDGQDRMTRDGNDE